MGSCCTKGNAKPVSKKDKNSRQPINPQKNSKIPPKGCLEKKSTFSQFEAQRKENQQQLIQSQKPQQKGCMFKSITIQEQEEALRTGNMVKQEFVDPQELQKFLFSKQHKNLKYHVVCSFQDQGVTDIALEEILGDLEFDQFIYKLELDLKGNEITDTGMEHFMSLFKSSENNLESLTLNLANNLISDIGIECLINCIKENTYLTSLSIFIQEGNMSVSKDKVSELQTTMSQKAKSQKAKSPFLLEGQPVG